MKMLFLDESGDHSLNKIDPSYPVFVLGGVIVERSYVRNVIAPRIQQLKERFFDRDDIILHTADIIRAKNGFEALKEKNCREAFISELNTMMRELDYMVIACAMRKDEHFAKYGANAVDPYMYCLDILVERFCMEVGGVEDGGFICAEERGPELDHALERAWAKIIRHGTNYAKGEQIDKCIVDLGIKEKGSDIAGLQLADLIVSPIGRAVMGKPSREDWEIVKSKFRRSGSQYLGYGLVIRP